jgi:hypothetical protein
MKQTTMRRFFKNPCQTGEEGKNMSHWFKVKTHFTSEKAIKKTANSLNFPIRHNQLCRGYGRNTTKCDLVMKLPGQYDVGFQKQQDGSYELVADFWSDHISEYLANPDVLEYAKNKRKDLIEQGKFDKAEEVINQAKISKFMQAYNLYAVEELAQMQGLQYIENRLEDGTILLELTGEGF